MIKCNYVINLKRRQDRLETFFKNKDNSILKNEHFIIFSAFDGFDYENEIKRLQIENHDIFKILKNNKICVPKGVLGCLMSHLLVLTKIVNNIDIDENDYVGIYEEDFCYCDDFDSKYGDFKNIDLSKYNIDILYTGGRFKPGFDCRNSSDFDLMFEKTDNPNLIKRKQMIYRNFNWDRGTFSYVVRKSICKNLIEHCISSFLTMEDNKLKFEAIDYVYTCAYDKFNMFDYVPHLFFSLVNHDSDIQEQYLSDVLQF
jgi:GR25 family glycosyltransferase involved in LPS biosynthesis